MSKVSNYDKSTLGRVRQRALENRQKIKKCLRVTTTVDGMAQFDTEESFWRFCKANRKNGSDVPNNPHSDCRGCPCKDEVPCNIVIKPFV